MNKKKIIAILVTVLILISVGTGIYFFLMKEDKKTTLNVIEKQWIENNKNNIIDLSIINNIPIFNYEGEGVIFDFIKALEEDTNLDFNEISFPYGEKSETDYYFGLTNEVTDKDILVYQDNYALITLEKVKYSNLETIPNIVVGVLSTDLESVNYYLKQNANIAFKTYENASQLINAVNSKEVNAIVLPKTIYLKQINNNSLNIAYNITELTTNLTIHLGDNKKLNTILKKYFKMWYENNYEESFNKYFSEEYFKFNGLYDESIATFKSKQYKYGYVVNEPYDSIVNGKVVGINPNIIDSFSATTGIDVEYVEYKSLNDLIKNFNENKIDFFLNTSSNKKFDMDVVDTVSVYDENYVVLANVNNEFVINSPSSLNNHKVLTIKDSKIAEYLKEWNVTVTEFNGINNLVKSVNNDTLIVIDDLTYEIYRHNILTDYKIIYQNKLNNDYNFVIRDIKDNEIFSDYFNFYLSFINDKEYYNSVNYLTFETKIKSNLQKYLLLIIVVLVLIIAGFIFFLKNKKGTKKSKETSISKESKLKYIDMLTSLKNRNYLNDSMEKWDDSEIYPQAVIIIDLNNIAYINDNYGHEEGDSVITEAANILIKNQIERTEIIRTNGNEFLIYLVQYDEKQVVTYMRKLNKEFKDLAHGFGAALGYSMIMDALKTVDDAINEATLDMRNNKEEVNN